MEIRNLTPHEITLHSLGNTIVIPPSGMVARVRTKRIIRNAIAFSGLKAPVAEIESLAIDGLPEPMENVVHIVSTFVAQHPQCRGREDVIAPDLHSAVRDGNGNVVAVSNFVRYS
jgi:hypothetical protein